MACQEFEIHVPGEAARLHRLRSRVLLGTGDEATLQLPRDTALSPLHLALEPGDAGVWVELHASASGEVLFEGSGYRRILVPWGKEVFVGRVRLSFLEPTGTSRPTPWILLLLPLLVGVVGFASLQTLASESVSAQEVEAPKIATETPTCSATGDVATHQARAARHAARSQWERLPFDLSEGTRALALFQRAAACFERAGLRREAATTRAEYEESLGALNDEYRALRLRLRVALDHKEYAEACAVVAQLRALLAHQRRGNYVEWLEHVGRDVQPRT